MNTLKPLIKHHLHRAIYNAQFNALANCHADGVNSIMLHDEPGNRVRMFVAHDHHPLWKVNHDGVYEFPLAIHPHHCNLQFIGIYGGARNMVYALTPRGGGDARFAEYQYISAITGPDRQASFTPTVRRADVHLISQEYMCNDPSLKAHELHSVFVPENEQAIWLVIEGKEDPHYSSTCWSNGVPKVSDTMYRQMSQKEIIQDLELALSKLK